MQSIQKADGFKDEKLIVLPNVFLEDISHHPLVKPIYLTDVGFFPHAQYHYRERPDGCNEYIFIYCVEGEGWAILSDQDGVTIHANSLLIIPAATPHRYGASETSPWSIYWFHLKGDAVEQFIQDFALSHSLLPVPSTQATKIRNLFEECYTILLYKGYSLKHYLYVLQAVRYLLGNLLLLHDAAQSASRQHEMVERSIQYMVEQIQSSLTLDDLARHVGLSKPHFSHLFKQVTSYTPIDYYLRLKIQRACHYLDITDVSVKEISQKVGIQDPYYFSRIFHKLAGQSPSDYRKAKQP